MNNAQSSFLCQDPEVPHNPSCLSDSPGAPLSCHCAASLGLSGPFAAPPLSYLGLALPPSLPEMLSPALYIASSFLLGLSFNVTSDQTIVFSFSAEHSLPSDSFLCLPLWGLFKIPPTRIYTPSQPSLFTKNPASVANKC